VERCEKMRHALPRCQIMRKKCDTLRRDWKLCENALFKKCPPHPSLHPPQFLLTIVAFLFSFPSFFICIGTYLSVAVHTYFDVFTYVPIYVCIV
jgi:hypothetical protein